IVPRGNEAPTLPVALGVGVDRSDDDCTTADDIGPGDTALQRILDQPAADALPGIASIDRKLPDQKTRNGIRRPSGADRTWGAVRLDDARCEAIIADHGAVIVNDQDASEPTGLV